VSLVSAVVANVVQRTDSWVNALTGLGTLRDKLTHSQVVPGVKLSDAVLESLFNDDDLAKRIVNKIPRDATRRGFRLRLEGADDDESVEVNRALMAQMHELGAMSKLREAWIWGRLYGGGAIYLGVDDGQAPEQLLDETKITRLAFLNVLRRPQLKIAKRFEDVTAEHYGEPEIFEVRRSDVTGAAMINTGTFIHASRLIIFEGTLTATAVNQRADSWWPDSVLQCVHDALRQTATSWQSVAHLISDASQGVLKIANLVDLIATNGQEELRTRIQMMDLARSVCRSLLIDADRESFERVATSFAGLPEMMDRMMQRVAAAAEMPVTLLFGKSPAGLNATGESDIRGWYDTVADAQTDVLKPRLERLVRILMNASDSATGGSEPDSWTIEFKPLWQPNELEQATILKLKADTHVALVTAQIEMEAEAGIALAADIPTIDAEHRRALLEADIKQGLRPGEATNGDEPEPDDEDADEESDDDESTR